MSISQARVFGGVLKKYSDGKTPVYLFGMLRCAQVLSVSIRKTTNQKKKHL